MPLAQIADFLSADPAQWPALAPWGPTSGGGGSTACPPSTLCILPQEAQGVYCSRWPLLTQWE